MQSLQHTTFQRQYCDILSSVRRIACNVPYTCKPRQWQRQRQHLQLLRSTADDGAAELPENPDIDQLASLLSQKASAMRASLDEMDLNWSMEDPSLAADEAFDSSDNATASPSTTDGTSRSQAGAGAILPGQMVSNSRKQNKLAAACRLRMNRDETVCHQQLRSTVLLQFIFEECPLLLVLVYAQSSK